MRSIYDISEDIRNCYEEQVDMETGEIATVCVNNEALDKLEMEREAKFEAVALWRKETMAMVDALKKEKANIDARKKQAENLVQSLDEYLAYHLDGQKFETPKVRITFRKSDQVVFDDMAFIPDEYLKIAEPTVNKAALKKAIKNGAEVPGVHLEEKLNINYK